MISPSAVSVLVLITGLLLTTNKNWRVKNREEAVNSQPAGNAPNLSLIRLHCEQHSLQVKDNHPDYCLPAGRFPLKAKLFYKWLLTQQSGATVQGYIKKQWGWLYHTVIATFFTAPGCQGLLPEVQHDEIFPSADLQSFNWMDVVNNHIRKQITLEKLIYFFISPSSTESMKWSQTGHLSCHFSSQVTSLKLPGPTWVPSDLFIEVKLQVIKTSTWVAWSPVTIFSHNDALMWQLN